MNQFSCAECRHISAILLAQVRVRVFCVHVVSSKSPTGTMHIQDYFNLKQVVDISSTPWTDVDHKTNLG